MVRSIQDNLAKLFEPTEDDVVQVKKTDALTRFRTSQQYPCVKNTLLRWPGTKRVDLMKKDVRLEK